jgi:hypothetical protein
LGHSRSHLQGIVGMNETGRGDALTEAFHRGVVQTGRSLSDCRHANHERARRHVDGKIEYPRDLLFAAMAPSAVGLCAEDMCCEKLDTAAEDRRP